MYRDLLVYEWFTHSERDSELSHFLLQNLIVFLAGGNDALAGFGSLDAEDLFQAVALFLVGGLLQLHLTNGLSGGLLLKDLHHFDVKLIATALHGKLSLSPTVVQITVGPPVHGRGVQVASAAVWMVESLAHSHALGERLSLLDAIHHKALALVVRAGSWADSCGLKSTITHVARLTHLQVLSLSALEVLLARRSPIRGRCQVASCQGLLCTHGHVRLSMGDDGGGMQVLWSVLQ